MTAFLAAFVLILGFTALVSGPDIVAWLRRRPDVDESASRDDWWVVPR